MKRLFQITKTEAHYILSSADELIETHKEESEILVTEVPFEWMMESNYSGDVFPFFFWFQSYYSVPWLDYFDLLQEKQIKRVE